MERGYFHHVKHQHRLKDEDLFYRFAEDAQVRTDVTTVGVVLPSGSTYVCLLHCK